MTEPDPLHMFDPAALAAAELVFPADGLPFPPMLAPPYAPLARGDWRLDRAFLIAAPGYFTGPRTLTWMNALLSRQGTSWMSLVPGEMESQMPHLAACHGKVVICGLGMGVMAFAVSALKAVERVVVVDLDAEVIALITEATGFESWPQRHKLEIVNADAREVKVDGVDFLYADIWPYYRMDCMLPDMRAIHRNIPAPSCGYWGQELDMVDWAAARGTAVDDFSMAEAEAFMAESGLPLIGREIPGYAELCRRAAVNPAIGAKRRPMTG